MKLQLYTIDQTYCDYLRNFDPCVPDNRGQKKNRPFVGIVLSVNGSFYYAPLTSPKQKHLQMKNQADFLKIDEGRLGAINFNNMIPVVSHALHPVDLVIRKEDADTIRQYKNLLINQKEWCQKHSDQILKAAQKLYTLQQSNRMWPGLQNRCCHFRLLEEKAEQFENPDSKENCDFLFDKK